MRMHIRRQCSQEQNHGVHIWEWKRKVVCDGRDSSNRITHGDHEFWQEKTCLCIGRYE